MLCKIGLFYKKFIYLDRLKELGRQPVEDDVLTMFADRIFKYKVNQTLSDSRYVLIMDEVFSDVKLADFFGFGVAKISSDNYTYTLTIDEYDGMSLQYAKLLDTTSDLTWDIAYSESPIAWNSSNDGGTVNFVSGHFNDTTFVKDGDFASADFELKTVDDSNALVFKFNSGLFNGVDVTADYNPRAWYFDKWE